MVIPPAKKSGKLLQGVFSMTKQSANISRLPHPDKLDLNSQ